MYIGCGTWLFVKNHARNNSSACRTYWSKEAHDRLVHREPHVLFVALSTLPNTNLPLNEAGELATTTVLGDVSVEDG